MVYNGTYISINTSLWAPHFALPMVGSTLCTEEKGTFTAYRYIGDMCLNLIISEKVIPFCALYDMNVTK